MTLFPFPDLGDSVTILAFLSSMIFVILLFGGAQYIMQGIAYLQFAKRTGTPYGWLGFIPVADSYLLGRISDAGYPQKKSGKRLLISEIITLALAFTVCILAIVLTVLAASNSASDSILWLALLTLLLSIGVIAASICVLVFQIIAVCRIAKNFGGASYSGWTAGLIVSLFCCQIAFFILLLILSTKTPAYTENDVAVEG